MFNSAELHYLKKNTVNMGIELYSKIVKLYSKNCKNCIVRIKKTWWVFQLLKKT